MDTSAFHVTRWFTKQPPTYGYWGPPTSSIDWCEANYQVSHYVAEWYNTISNLAFVSLALYGIEKCRQERLPLPLSLMHAGIAVVGIGSFLFHATLQYNWQLCDELPMIYFSSFTTYVAFDTKKTRSRFVTILPYLLALYDVIVTLVYLWYPNPVFHQVAYGSIQLVTTSRVVTLLSSTLAQTPSQKKQRRSAYHVEIWGAATFTLGFIIWNVDNIFCDQISEWKTMAGSFAFFLEGHAWWHLCTGLGAYWMVVGIQLLSLSLKEGPEGFELAYGLGSTTPYVRRLAKGKSR